MDNVCVSIDGKPLTDDEVEVVRTIRENKELNGELLYGEITFIKEWRKSENKTPMLLSYGEWELMKALGHDSVNVNIEKLYHENSRLIEIDRKGEVSRYLDNAFVAFKSINNKEVRAALYEIKREQESER